MKANKHKSIRWELEQLAQKKSPQNPAKPNAVKQQREKMHQKLGLNWKDVVIFSMFMFFTSLYQLNAHAQSHSPAAVDFDDIASGMMMSFNKTTGEYHNLRLVATDYDVDVFGLLATIKLKQSFYNDRDDWITEAVYAFPMADQSAVYRMRMTVGERVIEGEIHEKKQAEQIYQQAKSEGLTATMVKQYRPNIFTSDIANIGPQELISVEITFQLSLAYQQQAFELRLPMAIKPRYIPPGMDPELPATTGVMDAGQRRINVRLDAGFELDELRSLHHNVAISQEFDAHWIRLRDEQLYDANDFVLRWYPRQGQSPKAAYFSEQKGGYEYSLLMVMPPNVAEKSAQPRNLTYIMDTSGSMHGVALEQSKDALLFALSELDDQTYFNVIDFDSSAKALFPASRPGTPDNIQLALNFVDGFSSDGGTNMAPALQIAMQRENIKSGYLNQIIFMTDGSVGNEAQIFDQIAQDIGQARLFTIAIGPAPNNYFMSKAAMFGRGTYTHIAGLNQVNDVMSHLFEQLSRPALTDLAVTWNTPDVVQSPSVIPDLYMDQPLVITSKTPLNKAMGAPSFVVSGFSQTGGQSKTWSEQLQLRDDDRTTGIARLWARNQVEEMTDDLMLGGDYEVLKEQIIALALNHRLITEFTAMVAVDRNPDASRQAQAKAAQQVPYPQGSLGWRWGLLLGLLLLGAGMTLNRRAGFLNAE
ncbi:VIT domain-containing protein [Marinicella meishanensis]|uniref:VIT domain-containing protein n=1 Tax=Marinicella meishanensis TaxID=2873263 RepID=UPI001CC10655|nr:VIT domain-containing protein [Marinicella sp. NBU2979]